MKLVQLIHSALINSELRLALESGTLHMADSDQFELEAAAEVMRYSRNAIGSGSPLGKRGYGFGLMSTLQGWAWKEE